ncbi:efflux transporter periplasmic adaptor subunit [Rhodoblastus sphagnicola]|uniref:Efflux transporter periplasmic adaptor subunit n=1 Tax=Rhodoblastus sphagnicola TaxID=333368 RepID=A0A2S6NC79_9HYPH|nr:efflux RND transporter periplasmic adaptor subunit [Rhodoblastus sphagnicola]MBB4200659.1 multidrug efflux system membrane fusion protein [Rhodoblastus sphagnicola]PPQ32218.1 efflux transporter periplasmic adaptor subunit [Rhodoblastus sphagnicola]
MLDALRRFPEQRRLRAPLVITFLTLLAVFAGIHLWRQARLAPSAAAPSRPPIEVSAQTVRPETLSQSLEATGALEAAQAVTLAPEVAGRVTAIHFEAGARVEAGTPLVELYDAPERAERADAAARVRFARLQYDRSRRLAPSDTVSRQLLDQREAELEQAEAALQRIDANLAQKTIRAPFAGLIGIRRVNLGQYVNAGEAMATLTALDRLYVNFTLPQQELAKLRVGGDATVRADAYPNATFPARINAIEPIVEPDTRNIRVQATLANPDQMLRPGLYVTVSVAQPVRANAILAPATAIQTSASGDSVFVVRNGRAELTRVTIGQRRGDSVVVETGLGADDIVITDGQIRLQPGVPVRVVGPDVASTPQ